MDFGTGFDCVELDLFDAFIGFGVRGAFFEDFSYAGFYAGIGGIDVVEKDFLGLVT